MIAYARTDTRYLVHIYTRMKSELLENGNDFQNLARAAWTASTEICRRRHEKPRLSDSSHEDLLRRSRTTFNARQKYALREVFKWRDKVARDEDESDQYVLPNHMLLKICSELPKEMQGILACCNPIPPLVKQDLHALHLMILKAREQPMTVVEHDIEKPKEVLTLRADRNFVEDPLKSPLDLSHIADLSAEGVLLSPPAKLKVTKVNPKLKLFKEMKKPSKTRISDEIDSSVMTPYKRYQMLKPYLAHLHSIGQSADDEALKAHEDKVKSIRAHFDALTAMTASEYKGEEEEKEEAEEDDTLDRDEIEIEIDPGEVKPLRYQKKKGKKRSAKEEEEEGEEAKRIKEEDGSVDYEKADFSAFNKEKKAKNEGMFDPWRGNKGKKGCGKQRQRMKAGNRSMSYKK